MMLAPSIRPAFQLYRNLRLEVFLNPTSKISIFLNNELNSPDQNFPGYNVRIGGITPLDPRGISLGPYDMSVRHEIEPNQNLNTWYYGCKTCGTWKWVKHSVIRGPFSEGDFVEIPKI